MLLSTCESSMSNNNSKFPSSLGEARMTAPPAPQAQEEGWMSHASEGKKESCLQIKSRTQTTNVRTPLTRGSQKEAWSAVQGDHMEISGRDETRRGG